MAGRNLTQVKIEKQSQMSSGSGQKKNNKRSLEPQESEPSLVPPVKQVEGERDGSDQMGLTVDIKSFLKPGEKTYTQRCRLFVGNLPTDITEESFKKLFEKYGEPSEVFINRDRGFGFIRLESRTLAEIAKAELDGTVLKSRPLRIRFATHGAALSIKNLAPVVSNELLEEAFSIFGPVERAVVIVDDRGRATGKGFIEFAAKPPARKALEKCSEGAFILTTTPRPIVVEPMEQFDDEDGLPEKLMQKTQQYHKEREHPPRFAQPGTFEFEYSSRWKALDEMEKQQRDQVDRNMRDAKDKLESEMETARHEHQLMLMRQDLMRRQEELRRLEELRNQELQKRKQFQMSSQEGLHNVTRSQGSLLAPAWVHMHEEEHRRREEEIMRQREQDELRRQEGYKSNFMDNREQEMRMGDMGPRGAINMGDTYSPAPAGSQGPPPMMGMNMNRGTVPGSAMGPGSAIGSEGAANIGATLMADNGTACNDRFSQGGQSQMGSPMINRANSETPQPPVAAVGTASGGSSGFGRGDQGGNFEGPNKRRRY